MNILFGLSNPLFPRHARPDLVISFEAVFYVFVLRARLGDPCLEKGLSEQQCKVLGLRVDVRFYWLNRFTKAQTFPMTVVLVVTIVLGLITVLLPNTKEMPYKDRFD